MHDQAWLRLQEWVGRERREEDVVDPFPARAMAALLDRDAGSFAPGAVLPPAWHWLYFRAPVGQAELGEDGHQLRGGFLPPVPLPRRMWAGGRLRFLAPLRVGDAVMRVSQVHAVREKQGRSGPLIFVAVHHSITGPAGLACEEEQDIVYRDAPAEGDSTNGTSAHDVAASKRHGTNGEPKWQDRLLPTTSLLFRFSALTYNGHRIHYDQSYARAEGYRNIVVHAPLLALLLLDAATRREVGRNVAAFEYRATLPLFADEELLLAGKPGANGDGMHLHATDANGGVAMKAMLEWRVSATAAP